MKRVALGFVMVTGIAGCQVIAGITDRTAGAGGACVGSGCGGASGPDAGSGGSRGSGGADGSGAGTASGGSTNTGGSTNSGGTSGAGGSMGTGGLPGDAGGDAAPPKGTCPTTLKGPAMVNVPAPPGSIPPTYCMDSTEVTNIQYAEFLAAKIDGANTNGQDTWCSGWNTTFKPALNWPPAANQNFNPVGGVDWCDAFAYCKWAGGSSEGKHLCGKIGGGPNAYDEYNQAGSSEWYNACSKGGAFPYVYGSTYDGTACNVRDNLVGQTLPVPAKPVTCEGGYPGLFDLTGNVIEWENSCNGQTGMSDSCRVRGGSYATIDVNIMSCDYGKTYDGRNFVHPTIGFRCCGDAL